jgi:ribosomal protein S18 acetylase RimI-like enzyme
MSKSALRPHRLQDLSTPSLIQALEANINAQIPLMYADMPGVETFAEPGLLGMMTDLPDPMLNAVYQATFPPGQAEVRSGVERGLHRYRSRGCLPMTWFVTPSTRPGDLGRYLKMHQFVHIGRTPGMAADLWATEERPAPAGLVIEQVSSGEQLKQWLPPVTVSFELSQAVASAFFELFAGRGFGPDVPWRLYVGLVAGQPVAASRLFCAAGVAGIYHVATAPEARRRGFGSALTLAAVRSARELGYRVGVLVSSSEGFGVYRRLGFQVCCHADAYRWPAHEMGRN